MSCTFDITINIYNIYVLQHGTINLLLCAYKANDCVTGVSDCIFIHPCTSRVLLRANCAHVFGSVDA